jgi:hypothetical protein
MAANELINPPDYRNDTVLPLPMEVEANAWAVDAACSGNPGPMEYRCIDLATGIEVFRYGPVHGTNNIGEFLAIVHALALMDKVTLIYDDYCRDHLEPEGCRIIARMKDGSVIEKERIAFAPLDRAGIERKFTHTLSGRYGEQKTAEMLKLANALEAVEDVAEFTRLFR